MRFERTRDAALIKAILTHPRIWGRVIDDYTPPAEEWQPELHEQVWYVTAHDGDELLGLFEVYPLNHVCWESHVAFLPAAWGERARTATIEAMCWLMARTRCRRMVATIPVDNRLAIRFAQACGLKQYGRNPRSVRIGGELVDQLMFGISQECLCHRS